MTTGLVSAWQRRAEAVRVKGSAAEANAAWRMTSKLQALAIGAALS